MENVNLKNNLTYTDCNIFLFFGLYDKTTENL